MQEEEEKKTLKKRRSRWRLLWLVPLVPLALVVLTLLLLYIPGVLNLVASKVLPSVEESTGMHIQVADIRLRFPLRLEITDALVIQRGDTMLTARHADASVAVWPLLAGQVKVKNAEVTRAFYQMGGPDSLYVGAVIDSIGAAATMNLAFTDIRVRHAELNGARVNLIIGPDSTTTPKDTTASKPISMRADRLRLQNVDYSMRMTVGGDTIQASVSDASLLSGALTTGDTITIAADSIGLALTHGIYGKIGHEPLPGLDLDWLELTRGRAAVRNFTMRGTDMTVPIDTLGICERSGLNASLRGTYAMLADTMHLRQMALQANTSALQVDGYMGLDSIHPLAITATGSVMPGDVATAMPALLPMLAPLPNRPLTLQAQVGGSLQDLTIDRLAAAMAGIFSLSGSGSAANLTNVDQLIANVVLTGSLTNPGPVNAALPKGSGLHIPPLSLNAKATAHGRNYTAKLTGRTGSGRLALNGSLRGSLPTYSVDLALDSFPVQAFMPSLGIGAVSGTVKADGQRFNPMQRGARLAADATIRSIDYNGRRLGGLNLTARLDSGIADAHIRSAMPAANVDLSVRGRVEPKHIGWNLHGQIFNLNLQQLGLTDSVMQGSLAIRSQGFMLPGLDSICADAQIANLDWLQGKSHLVTDSLNLTVRTGADFSALTAQGGGIDLNFKALTPITDLLKDFSAAGSFASNMIAKREFYTDSLAAVMPKFDLALSAGPNNLVNDFLKPNSLSFSGLNITAAKDSIITANARVLGFQSGSSLQLDTISAIIHQYGQGIRMGVDVHNRPGTMDEFARVGLGCQWEGHNGTFRLIQHNIADSVGYKLGFNAMVNDSIISLHFDPLNPVIAYKDWTINAGNYLMLETNTKRLRANLQAQGAGSRIQLTSAPRSLNDSANSRVDDLTLRIDDVHIQDWLKLSPFAPPIAGDASAYVKLNAGNKHINGLGTLSLENLTYGKQRVGDLDLDIDVTTDLGGVIEAEATLEVDGKEALTASGAMNDSTRTEPFLLDLALHSLPLRIANPFLPKQYAQLDGALSGDMKVTGSLSDPIMNGAIRFDPDTKVDVQMIGSAFHFDTAAIAVDSNLVNFRKFAIRGSNANPLTIDGTVDLRKFSKPGIDLTLNASNMQVVDSKKRKNVNVYGKAFIDLDAKVRGSLQFLAVDAKLALLPLTNVTYMVESAGASAIGLENTSDMVRFVNFADTAAVQQADTVAPPSMMMMLDALLDIRQGSTITVDLSADGQNRAQIKGEGILDFTMSPAQPDGRLTGRFNINSGFFRYSLPVISEKNFSFNQGSYVAFNGPIMNPTLNIHATDDVKANVTRSGENSRLVIFDVGLGVTGTLERMDVAFDLSTNDDITVQNELRSMSPTQRANQAMNLLLYGTYTGQGTTGNANLSGNALYGFLTSQLNTWAANTIKGVDLTFGLDQYDRTRNGSTNTATQYSYQISKSLFNDRFKIVVGGNYSTDASSEENLSQNLISDISLDYMLNDAGSMYVRLFRHTGYESILEGEITQTGVGFVMRRKINSLRDLFIFRKKKGANP